MIRIGREYCDQDRKGNTASETEEQRAEQSSCGYSSKVNCLNISSDCVFYM